MQQEDAVPYAPFEGVPEQQNATPRRDFGAYPAQLHDNIPNLMLWGGDPKHVVPALDFMNRRQTQCGHDEEAHADGLVLDAAGGFLDQDREEDRQPDSRDIDGVQPARRNERNRQYADGEE